VTAALDGLTDTITLVLGDGAIAPVLRQHPEAAGKLRAAAGGPASAPTGGGGGAAAAMQALERLALAAGGGGGSDAAGSELVAAGDTSPPPIQQQLQQPRREPGQLQITRDTDWLVWTSQRVQTMLAISLPPLMTHPRPSVRLAVARAAACLLDRAPTALHGSWQALTEILLTLAQDDWPMVAGFAGKWLAGHGSSGGSSGEEAGGGASNSQLKLLVGRLALELLPAVRGGADQGTLAAKRLTTALMCAGPEAVAEVLLDRPSTLDQVVAALVSCFEVRPAGAALLLHAPAAAAGPFAAAAGEGGGGEGGEGSRAEAAAAALGGARAAPALPRMPLALAYLTTDAAYAAVASVARALARLARRASPATLQHLRRLVEALSARLRAAQQRQLQERPGGAAAARRGGAGADGSGWRCEAAAVVAVMSEVLFGASAAWQAPRPAEVLSRPQASPPAPDNQQQQDGDKGKRQEEEGVPAVGQADIQYESLVMQLLDAITNERLWGQPTAQPPRDLDGAPPLPAQLLGENALLLRALCDAAGAAARALGARFAGRPLRAALLPLMERLADPCALVADAAGGALAWVCIACGHAGGLGDLVGANADYVIDGLCARLRALRRHPRAPQLLAALLQRGGVAPELLPLMSEPLRGALRVGAWSGGLRVWSCLDLILPLILHCIDQ
jgi:hypothetical protein